MVYRRRDEAAASASCARVRARAARRARGLRRLGGLGPAAALAGRRAAQDEPGEDAPDAAARAGGARARAAGALRADLGAARRGVAASDPRGAGLGGPELLRPRRGRLEGDPGISREGRRSAPPRARRQHDHPAARQEPLLRHAEDAGAQAARARRRALARAGPEQGPHPHALPERDRVGRLRLRLRGGGAALVRQAGQRAHGGGSCRARRHDPQPAPAQPGSRPGAPRARDAARAVADGTERATSGATRRRSGRSRRPSSHRRTKSPKAPNRLRLQSRPRLPGSDSFAAAPTRARAALPQKLRTLVARP